MPPRIGHIILIDEPLALLSSETEYTLYASLFIYHAILMLHDEDGIDDDLFWWAQSNILMTKIKWESRSTGRLCQWMG